MKKTKNYLTGYLKSTQKKINNIGKFYQSKIEYYNIRDSAWLFLIKNKVKELPLDLEEICKNNNYLLIPINEYKDHKFIKHKIDEEAYTTIYNNTYIIFYKSDNIDRCRFSICHEIGHIVLHHIDALNCKEYERQANMFASRILMPMCVLHELHITHSSEIEKLCKVSAQSAKYRFVRYQALKRRNKFYTSKLEKKVIKNFKNYIKNY